MLVRLLAVLFLVGCGSEAVLVPTPLSKHSFGRSGTALVIGDVGEPGVTVEFARSVSGRALNYEYSAVTYASGIARLSIDTQGRYWTARAVHPDDVLCVWSSIPVNPETQVSVQLPYVGSAKVMDVSPLIVGEWREAGTNIVSLARENLTTSLLAEGVDSTTAAEIVAEVLGQDELFEMFEVIVINADGTFQDDVGTGNWSVEKGILTATDAEGETFVANVDRNGRTLTFYFSVAQFLELLKQTFGEWDAEAQEFFDSLYKEGDRIQFNYTLVG